MTKDDTPRDPNEEPVSPDSITGWQAPEEDEPTELPRGGGSDDCKTDPPPGGGGITSDGLEPIDPWPWEPPDDPPPGG